MSATAPPADAASGGAVESFRRSRAPQLLAVLGVAFAIILPFFLSPGGGIIDDTTIALAYILMALGLNIVVGFAGLLDLGYVAFFAFGAYTMGWVGSNFLASHRP